MILSFIDGGNTARTDWQFAKFPEWQLWQNLETFNLVQSFRQLRVGAGRSKK